MSKPFWLVWSPEGSNPKHCHGTLDDAKKEAKRLAKLMQGTRFFVVESVSSFVTNDIQETDLTPIDTNRF